MQGIYIHVLLKGSVAFQIGIFNTNVPINTWSVADLDKGL